MKPLSREAECYREGLFDAFSVCSKIVYEEWKERGMTPGNPNKGAPRCMNELNQMIHAIDAIRKQKG